MALSAGNFRKTRVRLRRTRVFRKFPASQGTAFGRPLHPRQALRAPTRRSAWRRIPRGSPIFCRTTNHCHNVIWGHVTSRSEIFKTTSFPNGLDAALNFTQILSEIRWNQPRSCRGANAGPHCVCATMSRLGDPLRRYPIALRRVNGTLTPPARRPKSVQKCAVHGQHNKY